MPNTAWHFCCRVINFHLQLFWQMLWALCYTWLYTVFYFTSRHLKEGFWTFICYWQKHDVDVINQVTLYLWVICQMKLAWKISTVTCNAQHRWSDRLMSCIGKSEAVNGWTARLVLKANRCQIRVPVLSRDGLTIWQM